MEQEPALGQKRNTQRCIRKRCICLQNIMTVWKPGRETVNTNCYMLLQVEMSLWFSNTRLQVILNKSIEMIGIKARLSDLKGQETGLLFWRWQNDHLQEFHQSIGHSCHPDSEDYIVVWSTSILERLCIGHSRKVRNDSSDAAIEMGSLNSMCDKSGRDQVEHLTVREIF